MADGTRIVGAGQAGYWVAKTLRDGGYDEPVTLIGAEPHPPYERPPLSKALLQGTAPESATWLTTEERLAELRIDFLPRTEVTAIDCEARTLIVTGGAVLPFDNLVLATGGRARTIEIPGSSQPIATLRTLNDAAEMRRSFADSRSLLVIGGGWIGLEVASTARRAGLAVTVVEAGGQLCGRLLPRSAAADLLTLHQDHGVEVRLGCTVASVDGRWVVLSTGERIACDRIVAGVGMLPNSGIAAAAGLDVDDGIVVDASGQTSQPGIYAAGDVSRFPASGGSIRLESWSNAMNQGIAVARAILGDATPYDPLPWFWSDQYDTTVQIVGLPMERHDHLVRRNSAGGHSHIYLASGLVAAAVSFDAARDNRALRTIIEGHRKVSPMLLADSGTDLQRLARAS